MRKCSTSQVIREMPIKTICHHTPRRMDKIQNTGKDQMLAKLWSNRNSHLSSVGIRNGRATLEEEDNLGVSHKTKPTPNTQSRSPAPWSFGTQPQGLKAYVHTVLTAALFTYYAQPGSSQHVLQYVNKHTVVHADHAPFGTKKELSSHEKRWRNLKKAHLKSTQCRVPTSQDSKQGFWRKDKTMDKVKS